MCPFPDEQDTPFHNAFTIKWNALRTDLVHTTHKRMELAIEHNYWFSGHSGRPLNLKYMPEVQLYNYFVALEEGNVALYRPHIYRPHYIELFKKEIAKRDPDLMNQVRSAKLRSILLQNSKVYG
jgi:hypothetical protein